MTTAEQRQKWAEEERDDLADRLYKKQQEVDGVRRELDELRSAARSAVDGIDDMAGNYDRSAYWAAADAIRPLARLLRAEDTTEPTEETP